jgi:hypothetical protein
MIVFSSKNSPRSIVAISGTHRKKRNVTPATESTPSIMHTPRNFRMNPMRKNDLHFSHEKNEPVRDALFSDRFDENDFFLRREVIERKGD